MLYTSLYSLFKAQQIILYEISSIAAVNNELCGRQGKGGEKRGCINFDTPSFIYIYSSCQSTYRGGEYSLNTLQWLQSGYTF